MNMKNETSVTKAAGGADVQVIPARSPGVGLRRRTEGDSDVTRIISDLSKPRELGERNKVEAAARRSAAHSFAEPLEKMTMATTLSKKESASKPESTLSRAESALIDAYWRAANYLSVGQIYLLDNPLLREPLKEEHIKPRLLGHWGTTPGLNFIYAHLNRLIKKLDLEMIYITGPGHGGPGLVANTYLEGTYSEVYPGILAGRRGYEAALHPILVSGRNS